MKKILFTLGIICAMTMNAQTEPYTKTLKAGEKYLFINGEGNKTTKDTVRIIAFHEGLVNIKYNNGDQEWHVTENFRKRIKPLKCEK